MEQRPQDLWTGGPWEQPSPRYNPPPLPTMPLRRESVLRRRKKRRRALFPFLGLLILIAGLLVGVVATRYLLPQEEGEGLIQSTAQQGQDPFADLERAPTGTGATVTISPQGEQVLTAAQIYEKCVPSIVSIEAYGAEGGSSGTGVIMTEDGYIITNAHVVSGMESVYVVLSDDRTMTALLVGADAQEDIAVLKVEPEEGPLEAAEFGNSALLRCGDTVVAIGDPLGYRASITQGIVSALNRSVDVDGVMMDLIQTSAPINFGNSGGALINDRGQVVGITTVKIISEDGGVEGLGFAIPMAKVKTVAERLIAGRDAPVLGITVDTRPQEGGGLYIRQVERDSNAWACGVRDQDVLVELNGQAVNNLEELKTIRDALVVGESVDIAVLRDGQRLELSFVVQGREELSS
jgi:serine protease Do